MEVIFTQEQLENKLTYWQKRLRLQDWEIKAKISRQREMQEGRQGEIVFNVHNKVAMIKILDSVDYDDWDKQDMESTLVHELLHLHFSQISYHFGNESSIYDMFEEQAIESIVSGLINVERK